MGLYDLYREEDEAFNPYVFGTPPAAAAPGAGGGAPPAIIADQPGSMAGTAGFDAITPDAPGKPKSQADPFANGPTFNIPGAPRFDPGAPFVPPEFQRPTLQDAQNEPGFQFRQQQGNDALERSAAARGVLRTGGTLKDIVEYNQLFASQEYGHVFNRALGAYDRSYQAATGAYDRAYQGRRDMFAPRLADWQLRSQADIQRGMAAYGYNTRSNGGGGGGVPDDIPPPPTPPGGGRPGDPVPGTRIDRGSGGPMSGREDPNRDLNLGY